MGSDDQGVSFHRAGKSLEEPGTSVGSVHPMVALRRGVLAGGDVLVACGLALPLDALRSRGGCCCPNTEIENKHLATYSHSVCRIE